MLLLFLVGSIVLQAWAWWRLRKRVLGGEMTRLTATARYAGWAAAPFLLFVGILSGLVGVEELSGSAIIPEPMGRVALAMSALLLGIAGLGWAAFSISCALIGRPPEARK
jgi:hypothetical protein